MIYCKAAITTRNCPFKIWNFESELDLQGIKNRKILLRTSKQPLDTLLKYLQYPWRSEIWRAWHVIVISK